MIGYDCSYKTWRKTYAVSVDHPVEQRAPIESHRTHCLLNTSSTARRVDDTSRASTTTSTSSTTTTAAAADDGGTKCGATSSADTRGLHTRPDDDLVAPLVEEVERVTLWISVPGK